MKRSVSILAVLVLITAGTVCVLFVHHDDVRSDATALTPYSIVGESVSGSLEIGGETYPYVIADAAFGVDLVRGERSHCWVTLSFSRSNFGPFNNLEFDYWTMEGTQAPEGSVPASTAGPSSRYIYEDPLTGTELTFGLVNGMVERISFRGTTVNEFDGGLKYVTFEISASFDKEIVYVNEVVHGTLPEPITLNISGEENGLPMSGTLSIVPMSCIVWDGGREHVVASVTLDIPGTSIPDSVLVIITEVNEGYGFIGKTLRMQYLDAEGNYIDQDIAYRLSGGDEPALILEGTVTSSVLDSECGIVEETRCEFCYGVV